MFLFFEPHHYFVLVNYIQLANPLVNEQAIAIIFCPTLRKFYDNLSRSLPYSLLAQRYK